jgi:hypothetical protein
MEIRSSPDIQSSPGAVKGYVRSVFPRFFEIPKLDALKHVCAAFQINDAVSALGRNSTTYSQLLRRAVTVIHDNFLAKKVLPAHSELHGPKRPSLAIELNSVMILAATDARVPQKPPCEAMRKKRRAGTKSQESCDRPDDQSLKHLGLLSTVKTTRPNQDIICSARETQ